MHPEYDADKMNGSVISLAVNLTRNNESRSTAERYWHSEFGMVRTLAAQSRPTETSFQEAFRRRVSTPLSASDSYCSTYLWLKFFTVALVIRSSLSRSSSLFLAVNLIGVIFQFMLRVGVASFGVCISSNISALLRRRGGLLVRFFPICDAEDLDVWCKGECVCLRILGVFGKRIHVGIGFEGSELGSY